MKQMKRTGALALAILMAALLAGCAKKTETLTVDEEMYSAAYENGYNEGYAAGRTSVGADYVADDTLLPFYSSDKVRISAAPLKEDSQYAHISFLAENLTAEEQNIELSAVALNGYSMEATYSAVLPAEGSAWILSSVSRQEIDMAGDLGDLSRLMALFHLYDKDYLSIDDILAEVSLNGETPAAPAVESGETLYEEGGIKIQTAGLGKDEADNGFIKLYVENNSELPYYLGSEGGVIAAEEVYPAFYRTVLPGTKAVGSMMIYTKDFEKVVDPETISFVSVVFRISNMIESGDYVMTDPLKITLGGEGRFQLSSDAKELTVSEVYYIYDDGEWVVESSDPGVLYVESSNVYDADDGISQMCVVKCAGKSAGDAKLSIKYHPAGESLQETDDYYPLIYLNRELYFTVGQDGAITAGEVTLSITDYMPNEPITYNYCIDKDGNVTNKFSSFG